MKALKKFSTLFLALCLTISCFSLTAFAADGRISFSDPSTKVGDDVEVTVAVRSEGNNMQTVEVDIDYDTEYLKFRSGESVTEGNTGELILNSSQGGTDIEFTLTFQALKEGSTSVTIESYRITDEDGDSMDFTMGNSAVTIDEGDPSKIEDSGETSGETSGSSSTNDKTATIEVDGVQYTLTGDFPDSLIPSGYVRADVSLGGEELPMLKSETSGAVLAYLVNSSGAGDFFYYDQEADSMWPYAEVTISDSTTLLLLSDTSKVSLPEIYKQATLTIDDKDFPTWQDTSNDQGYYIIYGLASDGDKGYYRYDSRQGTYQRFEVDAAEDTVEEEALPEGILGQIEQFVSDHMLFCIFAAAVILVILLIILLVVAVKLHNRNSELDELYDEYGIDEEPEPEPQPKKSKKASKKEQKKAKKAREEEEFEEDYNENLYGNGEDLEEEDFDEEDFEDEELDDEEYDDEYEEEILDEDDLEEDLDEEDFFDDEYDDSDEDPLDLSGNLSEATGELNVAKDEDFEEDDDDLGKTVALNSRDQVKAARKAAAENPGTAAKAAKAVKSGSSAKSGSASRTAKSAKDGSAAQSAKSARSAQTSQTARSAKAGQSGSAAQAAPAKKAAKTAQPRKASKDVDADLESVPEDEDIFAGYEKREELTLDDLWGEDNKKKKRSHQEDDDEFKVDFIDLD